MSINKVSLMKALSNVIEPSLNKDIVSLGLVSNITIENQKVRFTLAVKNNALHYKNNIEDSVKQFVKKFCGETPEIEIDFTLIKTHDASSKNLSRVNHIIAIASGKGGVGKSTISANLAIALRKKGKKVGLIDADIYGPSIPSMFNVELERPVTVDQTNNDSMMPIEAYGIKLMSIGFFNTLDNAIVWRGPMATKAINQILFDTAWGELDYLLIDLPPGTGDIHLSLVQFLSLTGTIIVTTPQKIALIDAIKAINMFKLPQIDVPILGIIENMSYFTPKELPDSKYYLFGKHGGKKVAEDNQIPLLSEVPIVSSIREAGDVGRPVAMQEDTILANIFQDLANTFVNIIENMKIHGISPSTPTPISHKKGCSKK